MTTKTGTLIQDEDEYRDIDVTILCRLCLNKEDNLIDIFANEENLNLSLRIMACASLEVLVTDALPNKICPACRFQLEKSYLFRKKCKNADTKLRRHQRLVNAGKRSTVFDASDDENEDDYQESMDFFSKVERTNNKKIDNEKQQLLEQFEEEKSKLIAEMTQKLEDEKMKMINDTEDMYKKKLDEAKQKFMTVKSKLAYKSMLLKELESKPIKNAPKILNKMMASSEPEIEYLDTEIINTNDCFEENKSDEETVYEETIDQESQDDSNPADNDDNNSSYSVNDNDTKSFVISTKSNDFDNDDITLSTNDNIEQQNSFTIQAKGFKNENVEYCDEEDVDYLIENEEYYVEDINTEERNVFQLEEEQDQDDPDYDTIRNAVKATLGDRPGLDNFKMKILKKNSQIKQLEVTTSEGDTMLMEVQSSDNKNAIEYDENGEIKIFKCPMCPKSFTRRLQLNRHSSVHLASKGFSCKHCEKWFPSRSSMERHIRTHTGEKPFSCEECGRRFIQKEILKRHMMTHTNNKPFSCNVCEKKFAQRENLRQHLNRHHTENPIVELHKCNLCTKVFCFASGLSRHLLIHAGRTYQCEKCNKKFTDKSALKRHSISAHAKQDSH